MKRLIISIIVVFSMLLLTQAQTESFSVFCNLLEDQEFSLAEDTSRNQEDEAQLLLDTIQSFADGDLRASERFANDGIDEYLDNAIFWFLKGCVAIKNEDTRDADEAFQEYFSLTNDQQIATLSEIIALQMVNLNAELSDDANTTNQPSDNTTDLGHNYDDTIASLESHRIIAEGGELLTEERSISLDSRESLFELDADTRREVVVGAQIEFTPNERDFEACGFANYITFDGDEPLFVQTGVMWDDTSESPAVYVFDAYTNESLVEVLDQDFRDSLYLVVVLVDGEVTLYINGEAVISGFGYSDDADGAFSLSLITEDKDTTCELSDVWIHELQR
jgi:hypothetical protein